MNMAHSYNDLLNFSLLIIGIVSVAFLVLFPVQMFLLFLTISTTYLSLRYLRKKKQEKVLRQLAEGKA